MPSFKVGRGKCQPALGTVSQTLLMPPSTLSQADLPFHLPRQLPACKTLGLPSDPHASILTFISLSSPQPPSLALAFYRDTLVTIFLNSHSYRCSQVAGACGCVHMGREPGEHHLRSVCLPQCHHLMVSRWTVASKFQLQQHQDLYHSRGQLSGGELGWADMVYLDPAMGFSGASWAGGTRDHCSFPGTSQDLEWSLLPLALVFFLVQG